jgi:hypothetical protein
VQFSPIPQSFFFMASQGTKSSLFANFSWQSERDPSGIAATGIMFWPYKRASAAAANDQESAEAVARNTVAAACQSNEQFVYQARETQKDRQSGPWRALQ